MNLEVASSLMARVLHDMAIGKKFPRFYMGHSEDKLDYCSDDFNSSYSAQSSAMTRSMTILRYWEIRHGAPKIEIAESTWIGRRV